MAKSHVSLNVTNIERSVAFYRSFFGVEPAKLKHDYAKFDLLDPPLNFTMSERAPEAGEHGRLAHLGIQVDGHAGVEAARKRLELAGLISLDESDTVCCYARQDKVWATDPDGNEWEVFFVMEADVPAESFLSEACAVPAAASGCGPDEAEAASAPGGCC